MAIRECSDRLVKPESYATEWFKRWKGKFFQAHHSYDYSDGWLLIGQAGDDLFAEVGNRVLMGPDVRPCTIFELAEVQLLAS